jgi:MYXO-CTERM domain-containing protein
MRHTALLAVLGFVGFTLGGSSAAQAGEALTLDLPPQGIYGGMDTAVCGWPTTVSMEGQCTGTLVHPEVVIYAAHCGSGYNQVWFGENIQGSGGRKVPTEFCKTYPGGGPGSGNDFAFCKLAQPVTDVPLVPILMGCETSVLTPGREVTIVGFGNANNGPYGIKREVVTTINTITGQGEAFIGGGGKDSCQGDSGGPVYVRLASSLGPQADDSWRVFGITSYGGACGSGGYYSMMHNGIEWFESESGIDLTPCHDSDGTWKPAGGCLGFPIEPGKGGGTWSTSCEAGPVAGASELCGDPLAPDDVPPTAVIIAPEHLSEHNGEGGANVELTITVDAQDDNWGVGEVVLLINGMEVGSDFAAPYEWTAVSFPTGQWTIGAMAVDLNNNVGYAEDVVIGVNTPAPEPEPETTGTSGGDSDTGGTDGTGTSDGTSGGSMGSDGSVSSGGSAGTGGTDSATGGQDEDGGCACSSSGGRDGGLALVMLGLLALPRRRSRAA